MDETLIKTIWFDMVSASRLEIQQLRVALAQAQKEIADLRAKLSKPPAE